MSKTVYETSAVGSRVPSLSGDIMNRSTQDLVPKEKDDRVCVKFHSNINLFTLYTLSYTNLFII